MICRRVNALNTEVLDHLLLIDYAHVRVDSPQLQEFSDECRQLGRSYALIMSARTLRETLDRFLTLFHENARHLPTSLPVHELNYNHSAHGEIDPSQLPSCLEHMAEAFERLRERLCELHVYTVSSSSCALYLLLSSR